MMIRQGFIQMDPNLKNNYMNLRVYRSMNTKHFIKLQKPNNLEVMKAYTTHAALKSFINTRTKSL